MDENTNMDLIRDHVDTFILRFLANGDGYGYDIHKAISSCTDGVYELKQPTLYSCLKRLEKQGFITSYDGETSSGAQRRYYSLTEKGRDYLNKDIEQWEFSRTLLNRLLSDKEFDLTSAPKPFDPSALRPRTKRGSGIANSDKIDGEIPYDGGDYGDKPQNSPMQSVYQNNEKSDVIRKVAADKAADNGENGGIIDGGKWLEGLKFSNTAAPKQNTEQKPSAFDVKNLFFQPPASSEKSGLADEGAALSPQDILSRKVEAQQMDFSAFDEEKPQDSSDFLREYLTERESDETADDYRNALDGMLIQKQDMAPPFTREVQQPVVVEQPASNGYNYSELKERAQSLGYKLRPYSKATSSTYYSMNFIYSSKLKRDTFFLLYLFMLAEIAVSFFTLDRFVGFGYVSYVIAAAVLVLVPLFGLIAFLMSPDKRMRAEFNLRISLAGMSMIFINACMICLLFAFFLFNADISAPSTLIKPVLYPAMLLINLPVYSLFYALLYNSRRYHLK